MRGADANSDHHLVLANIRLKLCKERKKNETSRRAFNTQKLQDPQVQRCFQLEIRNRFHQLKESDGSSIEEEWKQFRTAYTESAEKVLGLRRRENKDWITPGTYAAMEERRKIKEDIGKTQSERLKESKRQKYRMKDKEVKGRARADKRRKLEEMAETAENAARNNQMSVLYKITKQLSRAKKSSSCPIKTKDGQLITEEAEVLERWKEHFQEVLNVPEVQVEMPEGCNIQEAQEESCIDTSPITLDEVKKALKRQKSGKSPGVDNINAEMMRSSSEDAALALLSLFNRVLAEGTVPTDWKRSLIVKIPKKGDLSVCDNYRGVSLLSVPSKIFCRIVIDRIREGVEKEL